jgi:hypothetical protein
VATNRPISSFGVPVRLACPTGLRVRPRPRQHRSAADQQPRIDPKRPADQPKDHDRADPEAATAHGQAKSATAAALAAPVLDIAA